MVHLEVDLSIADGALRADYCVSNVLETRQILVFTKLFRSLPSGQKVVDPQLVYVTADSKDKLILEKVAPGIPVGIEVDEPELPFAELLQPGQSTTGVALVSWPPHSFTPYSGLGAVLPVSQIREAIFRIGFVEIDGDTSFWRQANGQVSGTYIVEYDMAFALQHFVSSKSLKL